jgi:hypothetical protein
MNPSDSTQPSESGPNVQFTESAFTKVFSVAAVPLVVPRSHAVQGMPPTAQQRFLLPPFDSGAQTWTDVIIPPAEIVQGAIHAGTKTVIVGGSKAYKTWAQMDLGYSVALGLPWWGLPTTRQRVLFINLEIPAPHARKRMRDILRARGGAEPAGFVLWNLRGHILPAEEMIRQIIMRIQQEREMFGLIIVDPIYKMLGGRDENSAGDITELLNSFEKLAVETGAAVVFGAHMSKGNQAAKEPMDRASGSGVFARDPDTIIVLTKHEEADAFAVDLVLRNFPPMPSFVVRREHPLMVRAEDLNPDDLKMPRMARRPQKPTPTVEIFMDIFPKTAGSTVEDSALGNSQIAAAFRDKNWEPSSIKALKEEAMQKGLLRVLRFAHNRQLFGRAAVLSHFLQA